MNANLHLCRCFVTQLITKILSPVLLLHRNVVCTSPCIATMVSTLSCFQGIHDDCVKSIPIHFIDAMHHIKQLRSFRTRLANNTVSISFLHLIITSGVDEHTHTHIINPYANPAWTVHHIVQASRGIHNSQH